MSNQIVFEKVKLKNTLKYFFQSSSKADNNVKERILKNYDSSMTNSATIKKSFKTLFSKEEPTIDEMIEVIMLIKLNKADTFDFEKYKYYKDSKVMASNIMSGNLELDIDSLLAKINKIRIDSTPPKRTITKDKFLKYIDIKLNDNREASDSNTLLQTTYSEKEFAEYLTKLFKSY